MKALKTGHLTYPESPGFQPYARLRALSNAGRPNYILSCQIDMGQVPPRDGLVLFTLEQETNPYIVA